MTTITTEEAERLAIILNRLDMDRNATALRSLAAERDALRAERNAEVGHRLKAEGALFNMERRIARQRRVLAKLYGKRHDRKAERDYLEKTAMQAAQCHGRETLRADGLQAENARLREALRLAIESVEFWAAYASPYFQDKHDLAGDLQKLRAALGEKE
jgi:hypothetical protein